MISSFAVGSGKRDSNTQAGMVKVHPSPVSPNISQTDMLASYLPDSGRCCGHSFTLHQCTLVTLF